MSDPSKGPDFPPFFIFNKNKEMAKIQRSKDHEAIQKNMKQKFGENA